MQNAAFSIAFIIGLTVAQAPRPRADVGPSSSSSSSSSGNYWHDAGSGYVFTPETVGIHLDNASSAAPSLCVGADVTCTYGWAKTSGNDGLTLSSPAGTPRFSIVKNGSDPTILELWGNGNSDMLQIKNGAYVKAKGSAFIAETGGSAQLTVDGNGVIVNGTYPLIMNNTRIVLSSVTPDISSGFGTSPSITAGKGYAFRVNVGTGGVATTGVIAFNATATTGWNCNCTDITTHVGTCQQTASNTTTASFGQFTALGVAQAWADSDVLAVTCTGF